MDNDQDNQSADAEFAYDHCGGPKPGTTIDNIKRKYTKRIVSAFDNFSPARDKQDRPYGPKFGDELVIGDIIMVPSNTNGWVQAKIISLTRVTKMNGNDIFRCYEAKLACNELFNGPLTKYFLYEQQVYTLY